MKNKMECGDCGRVVELVPTTYRLIPEIDGWVENLPVGHCECGAELLSVPPYRGIAVAFARELAMSPRTIGPAEIAVIRDALGEISMNELARRLGVTPPSVHRWEHGGPVPTSAQLHIKALVLLTERVFELPRVDADAPAEPLIIRWANGRWYPGIFPPAREIGAA